MLHLPGAPALSAFRTDKLLQRAREAGIALEVLHTRYQHFVDLERHLDAAEQRRLERLLEYGARAPAVPAGAQLFLVVPRLGNISPWASKATDIAHNCGLDKVHRIERGVSYQVLTPHDRPLEGTERRRFLELIHDRMTESVLESFEEAEGLA